MSSDQEQELNMMIRQRLLKSQKHRYDHKTSQWGRRTALADTLGPQNSKALLRAPHQAPGKARTSGIIPAGRVYSRSRSRSSHTTPPIARTHCGLLLHLHLPWGTTLLVLPSCPPANPRPQQAWTSSGASAQSWGRGRLLLSHSLHHIHRISNPFPKNQSLMTPQPLTFICGGVLTAWIEEKNFL